MKEKMLEFFSTLSPVFFYARWNIRKWANRQNRKSDDAGNGRNLQERLCEEAGVPILKNSTTFPGRLRTFSRTLAQLSYIYVKRQAAITYAVYIYSVTVQSVTKRPS